MIVKFISLLLLANIYLCSESYELELISKKAVEYHAEGQYSNWKDLLDENIIIESLGRVYNGLNEVDTYLKHLNINKSKIKVLTPFNVRDNYVTFAKEVNGEFNNGCSFLVSNIIQLIHYNDNLKIDKWVEHWPSNFKQTMKCKKDEL